MEGTPDKKQDPYRSTAGVYDLFFDSTLARLRAIGTMLFPPRENISVLDVGCGTGSLLALYRKPNCSLFGVDSSPAMLTVARHKLGDIADLRLEDASQMTFANRMFDFISIVLVLHEMCAPLRSAVLGECKRVVKTDGRMLLIDYHFGPYSFPEGWKFRLLRRFAELLAGREHFMNYCDFKKRGGLEPLIAETQLEVEKRFVSKPGTTAAYLLKPQISIV